MAQTKPAQQDVLAETRPAQQDVLSVRLSKTAAKAIVARPCVMMCSCCAFIWVIIGVTIPFLTFSPDGPKDWALLDMPHTTTKDSIVLAELDADCRQYPDPCPLSEERSLADMSVIGTSILYEAPGDIFTPERLQRICEVERLFTGAAGYADTCQLVPGAAERVEMENGTGRNARGGFNAKQDCVAQSGSVVSMFYGGVSKDCPLLPSSVVDAVRNAIYAGLSDPETFTAAGFFIGNDVIRGANYTGGRSVRTRSLLGLGYPLKGQLNDGIQGLMQPKVRDLYISEFYSKVDKGFLDFFEADVVMPPFASEYNGRWVHGDVEVWVASATLSDIEEGRAIDSDLRWVIASIIFVWIYIAYHTGSLFVATVSLWQIVMSIILAYFVYTFIFQITYYRQLHSLLIFIILGIGADDVFVFSDAWKHSEVLVCTPRPQGEGDQELGQVVPGRVNYAEKARIAEERIAHAYRHAMVAVGNTSLTTGMAFVGTAISPLMSIRSMGIYAFTLVAINYFLVITLTPCTFAVWHMYDLNIERCCCCLKRFKGRFSAKQKSPQVPRCCGTSDRPVSPAPCPASEDPESQEDAAAMHLLALSRTTASPFITKAFIPVFRNGIVTAVVALLLTVFACVNIAYAAQLESSPEAFTLFGDQHMSMRAVDKIKTSYAAGSDLEYNVLTVSFGVKTVDRNAAPGINQWKPHEFYGKVVYDDAFDLSRPAEQQFLREFCQKLRDMPCPTKGCLPSGSLLLPGSDALSCFIEEFDAWNGNVTYAGDQFLDRLEKFRNATRPSSVIGMRTDWAKTIGLVGGKVKYVQVRAKMSLKQQRGTNIKGPILKQLMSFIDEEKSRAPAGLKTIVQSVPYDWIWIETNEALISSLFNGFAIGFPIAFVIVLISTRNVFISLLAIITVVFIVANVLGYCKMAGWYLGPGECVAGIIVIGLAVDYTIHLGHAYLEGAHGGLRGRLHRWEYALNSMGQTVIAGAATTIFAAFVMQFCQITFFNQMSTLICLTVTYSIIYTLGCFMGILRLLNPGQLEKGNIEVWIAFCRSRWLQK